MERAAQSVPAVAALSLLVGLIGIQSGDIVIVPERGRTLENLSRVASFVGVLAALANTVLIIVTR